MKSNGTDYQQRKAAAQQQSGNGQGNGNGARPPARASNAPAPIQFIEHHKAGFEDLFPSKENAKRFLDAVKMEVYKNKYLWSCKPASVYAAVKEAATLQLQPGLLGQAYLIPYKDMCQFQIGYKGYIDLARRSGDLVSLVAEAVYENDTFDCELGSNPNVKHVPYLGIEGRGDPVAYYAIAQTRHPGSEHIEQHIMLMTVAQITEHRDKFSQSVKSKRSSPWDASFDEMAKKTVIKRLMKYLPLSIDDQRSISIDEQVIDTTEDGEAVYYDWEEVADEEDGVAAPESSDQSAEEEKSAKQEKPADRQESASEPKQGGEKAAGKEKPKKGKENAPAAEDERSPEEVEDELF